MLAVNSPSVVDQHVKPDIALFEFSGHASYLGKLGEVRDDQIHLSAPTDFFDLRLRCFSFRTIAEPSPQSHPLASSLAVTLPIPELLPVTRHTFPCMLIIVMIVSPL